MNAIERIDRLFLDHARRTHRRAHAIQNSFYSGTVTDCLFAQSADYSAYASSNSEGTLLGGVNEQPWLPAGFFDQNNRAKGRQLLLKGMGVLGATNASPTLTFQVRMGSTSGSATLTGASIGVSAAITVGGGAGVTNVFWWFELLLTLNTPGIGAGNSTLTTAGVIACPKGFASPFFYAIEPTTPDTATWTQTFDNSVNQYINVSATWSAASGTNTITLKALTLLALN